MSCVMQVVTMCLNLLHACICLMQSSGSSGHGSHGEQRQQQQQNVSSAQMELGQLYLQGSNEASRCSSHSSSTASKPIPSCVGVAGEDVPRSRASSQTIVKKFHKLLNEPLVRTHPKTNTLSQAGFKLAL